MTYVDASNNTDKYLKAKQPVKQFVPHPPGSELLDRNLVVGRSEFWDESLWEDTNRFLHRVVIEIYQRWRS